MSSEDDAGPDDLAEPEAELDEAEELESEDDAESESEDEDDALDSEDEPAQPSNRRGRRILQLNEKLKAERDRNAELESTIQQLAATRDPLAQEIDEFMQRDLEEREANLSPEKAAQLRYERQLEQKQLVHQLRVQDELDQMKYWQIRTSNALPAHYDHKIEVLMSQARNRGENPSRVRLLHQLIGQDEMRDRFNKRHGGGRYGLRGSVRSTAVSSPRGRRSQAEDDEALLASMTVGQAFGNTE